MRTYKWHQTGQEPIEAEIKRDLEVGLDIHWGRWKHCQSCDGVEPTWEMEDRVPHTELEEKTHGRAESKEHHVDRMQENSKEQDEVESTSGRTMI